MLENLLQYRRIKNTVESLSVNDHICIFYETEEELLQSLIPFIQLGLSKNDACAYIVNSNSLDRLQKIFREKFENFDELVDNGRMTLFTEHDTYIKDGIFEPDSWLDFALDYTKQVTEGEFNVLRFIGEMSWALGEVPGKERLVEYESKINQAVSEVDVISMCQYNTTAFTEDQILEILEVHPIVIYRGFVCDNPYYVPPDEFFSEKDTKTKVYRMLLNIWERQRDITLLVETMEKQKALEAEMFRIVKFDSLGKLASGIAHDFKNILSILLGNLSLAKHSDGVPRDVIQLLEDAEAAGNQANKYIQKLFSISDIGAINPERIDPVEFLYKMCGFLNPLTKLKININSEGNINPIYIDKAQFEQVIQNIVLNANDAIVNNNKLDVLISNVYLEDNNILNLEGGNYVRIIFKDYGQGIEEEIQNKIFDPFFTTKKTGTGLGLSSCLSIITKHKGTVKVKSKYGIGSEFFVFLPIYHPANNINN